jgi:hypothetical protein
VAETEKQFLPSVHAPAGAASQPVGSYLKSWDTRLDARGAKLTVAPGPGWHVTEARWFDKNEAQGRTSVYLRLLDENGQLVTGTPVQWFWGSNDDQQDTKPTEIKHDPWFGDYSLDFNMYHPAPTYGFFV